MGVSGTRELAVQEGKVHVRSFRQIKTKLPPKGRKSGDGPPTCPAGWPRSWVLWVNIHAFRRVSAHGETGTHVLLVLAGTRFSWQSSFLPSSVLFGCCFEPLSSELVDGCTVFGNVSEIE